MTLPSSSWSFTLHDRRLHAWQGLWCILWSAVQKWGHADAAALVEYSLVKYDTDLEAISGDMFEYEDYVDKYMAVRTGIETAFKEFLKEANGHIVEAVKDAKKQGAEQERSQSMQHMQAQAWASGMNGGPRGLG